MSCRKIQFLIEAYVDGAASPLEREQVDAHVAQCEACARALAASRQLTSVMHATPARAVSDDFERKLARALQNTQPKPEAAAWWERFRVRFEWRLRVPALAAAASLAAAVFVGAVGPLAVQYGQMQQERGRMVTGAVARHRELQRAEPRMNWDAVEASIDLSAGHITTD